MGDAGEAPSDAPPDFSTQFVRTPDGRDLCFAEWGDLAGRPVFWIHGSPGCRLFSAVRIENGFEEVVRSCGVHLVTYDLPGNGRSTRLPGRRVANAAADIATIADALHLRRFGVVGGSSGSGPTMAAGTLLPDRVTRIVPYAPIAPRVELGPEEWSRGQDTETLEYLGWVQEGEDRAAIQFARLDAEYRAAAQAGNPADASVFERTRNGVWGWVDDEVSHQRDWGFDVASISVPTRIWYDPDDTVVPRQQAEWLARHIPGAQLVESKALGHGSTGDPVPEWREILAWVTAGDPADPRP